MSDNVQVQYELARQKLNEMSEWIHAFQRITHDTDNLEDELFQTWKGAVANAFSKELHTTILPSLEGLIRFLGEVRSTTAQALVIFGAAEEEAARLFGETIGGVGASQGDLIGNTTHNGFGSGGQELIQKLRENLNSEVVQRIRDKRNFSAINVLRADPRLIMAQIGLTLGVRSSAYLDWIDVVAPGEEWDFKGPLAQQYRDRPFQIRDGIDVGQDIFGNIHYGYIGRAASFSETELLGGAGVAQVLVGTSSWDFWDSYFDDPRDVAGVRMGIELYERYGTHFTDEQFLEVYKKYENRFYER